MINENEIARCVRKAMDGYFRDLEGERPCAIYDMVMNSVEKPSMPRIPPPVHYRRAVYFWTEYDKPDPDEQAQSPDQPVR